MNKMIYAIATSTILVLIPLTAGIAFALNWITITKIMFALWFIGEWILFTCFIKYAFN